HAPVRPTLAKAFADGHRTVAARALDALDQRSGAQELQDDERDDDGESDEPDQHEGSDIGRRGRGGGVRLLPPASAVVETATDADQEPEQPQRLVRAGDPQRFFDDLENTHGFAPENGAPTRPSEQQA